MTQPANCAIAPHTVSISGAASRTPDDVAIAPRHPEIALPAALEGDWCGNDAFRTAFFNSLSLTFPLGEAFFIDTIRQFQPSIEDAALSQEIRGFIGQEAIHRREHARYNQLLCEYRGYDDQVVENPIRERIAQLQQISPLAQLAVTVGFEHLTALLAKGMLSNKAWLANADADIARLWYWHCMEEAEHKGVTFDVYVAAGGDKDKLRQMLLPVTRQLFADVFRGINMMLRCQGLHRNPRIWAAGMNWLFGSPGVARILVPDWRAFTRTGFHPWDCDDRDLIERWQLEIS